MGIFILILIGILILFVTIILFLILCGNLVKSYIKKKPFSKRLLYATLIGVFTVSSIFLYKEYFFTFSNINKEYVQDGPGPIVSPSEKYTANAYYELYGGAAGGVNVWVDVIYNNEESRIETVYYADAKDLFSIEWLDEDTLYILNDDPSFPKSNRSIKLKIGKEIYHENGLACKSLLMKEEYETCYQKK